jgi:hypothetical protein
MLYVGDFVLFTPSEDMVVCEPKFDKTYAIIDCVDENQTEVCLTTFDGRKFQAIKIYENIKKLFDEDILNVQTSAFYFCDKIRNYFNATLLLELLDDFYDRLEHIGFVIRATTSGHFTELIIEIDKIIELLRLNHDKGYTTFEIDKLNEMKNYCLFFERYLR